MTTPGEILDFWFGDRTQPQREAYRDIWFDEDPAFDAEISSRFGADVQAANAGGLREWEETAEGALALILLLDQFNRNLHRHTAHAFAGNERAHKIARASIAKGFDASVTKAERQFFYMPLEHSECLKDQDRCCELMAALGDPGLLKYAEQHRAVVRRFGRFPHRNLALGRISTPEEAEFLKLPDSSFW